VLRALYPPAYLAFVNIDFCDGFCYNYQNKLLGRDLV